MNNEKKSPVLTVEILAPYLPYGLKMYHKESGVKIQTMTHFDLCEDLLQHHNKWRNKPILRPLSDLNNEIEHNGSRFVPWVEINKLLNEGKYQAHYNIIEYNEWGSLTIYFGDHRSGYSLDLEAIPVYQKLLSWHFDVFGLIEKRLAIDINYIEGKETNS